MINPIHSSSCDWISDSELMKQYHDTEWGVPLHDDQKHFEFLTLDAFQVGLSWLTILKKRENFRLAFDQFDWNKIAKYNSNDVERLMNNEGIIRNRQKIEATIKNAQAFINVRTEFGSFDKYIWQFTGNTTIQNHWLTTKDIPAQTAESVIMSKNLKKRGFAFVGPTICYAYMQAAGLVNDHLTKCFRHK
jgi:DNA-3-methyladenine glycosylase I